ncbi:hypothetical protein BH11BAC1_BH11BAC1_00120 [soil metagenome]
MTHQNTNSKQKAVSILKKIASIIFFLTVFYLIPLIGNYSLLVNWRVIFLATICTILFATQPRLSIAEAKEKKSTDRNTIWLILIGSGVGQITSLIEWAYFSDKIIIGWTIIGASLLIVGTFFRLYAIHVLGKYFSSTVQIKEEHKVISIGPYKYLRHPSYTGAYIAMVGSAVFLHSIIGILIFGIGMLFVYRLRINTEEETLTNQFKQEYLNYSKHTYKMFPLVW